MLDDLDDDDDDCRNVNKNIVGCICWWNGC